MSFKITGQLSNTTTLNNVLYSNQQSDLATDENDGELLYYENGGPQSSPALTFDGTELLVDASLSVEESARSYGWITSSTRHTGPGTPLYPPVPYGSNISSGASIGWNFSVGRGTMDFMNNYESAQGGFYFRQRTGDNTSAVVLASTFSQTPSEAIVGNTFVSNLHSTGITRFALSPIRSRPIDLIVYSGTIATGLSNSLILELTNAGMIEMTLMAPGTNQVARYIGTLYRSSGTAGQGYSYYPATPNGGGQISANLEFGFGASTAGKWQIYGTNNTGVIGTFIIRILADPLIS